MLGRTAGGLYWLFRYFERSENVARLIEAGFRIAETRTGSMAGEEWASVLATAGADGAYRARHDGYDGETVVDFLLRDREGTASVMAMVEAARTNARSARTALTREVWEAVNDCWMTLRDLTAKPVAVGDLPAALNTIRQQGALVRGALHGTMLRNDIYDFCRIGTFLERADATARLLDVKYYVLLPSVTHVGTSLDNAQWESVLRSVSALQAYRWSTGGEMAPAAIARFLILDPQMPRSLAFCVEKLSANLGYLADDYGARRPCHDEVDRACALVRGRDIDAIFEEGLHEFVRRFIAQLGALGAAVERDYRFTG